MISCILASAGTCGWALLRVLICHVSLLPTVLAFLWAAMPSSCLTSWVTGFPGASVVLVGPVPVFRPSQYQGCCPWLPVVMPSGAPQQGVPCFGFLPELLLAVGACCCRLVWAIRCVRHLCVVDLRWRTSFLRSFWTLGFPAAVRTAIRFQLQHVYTKLPSQPINTSQQHSSYSHRNLNKGL